MRTTTLPNTCASEPSCSTQGLFLRSLPEGDCEYPGVTVSTTRKKLRKEEDSLLGLRTSRRRTPLLVVLFGKSSRSRESNPDREFGEKLRLETTLGEARRPGVKRVDILLCQLTHWRCTERSGV